MTQKGRIRSRCRTRRTFRKKTDRLHSQHQAPANRHCVAVNLNQQVPVRSAMETVKHFGDRPPRALPDCLRRNEKGGTPPVTCSIRKYFPY